MKLKTLYHSILLIFLIVTSLLCTPNNANTSKFTGKKLSPGLIKGTFIYKLTNYIKWPEKTEKAKKYFIVGIIGKNFVRNFFEKVEVFPNFKNRPIHVRVLTDIKDIKDVGILLIGSDMNSVLPDILKEADNRGVLTISDKKDFGSKGVMINFFHEKNRLRFEVNLNVVNKNMFFFSSKILKLAKIVGEKKINR